MFEIEPMPRIDVLVDDAATGERRRRTTYSGVIWLGGRLSSEGGMVMTRTGGVEAPAILPDSLAYDPAKVGDAVLTATYATASAAGDRNLTVALRSVTFAPDPEGRPPVWIQLHIAGSGPLPCGVSYRVEAYTVPDPVLTP
jgi:hypothetical protein